MFFFLYFFASILHTNAAFNDASNPDISWDGNSVHPNVADSNRFCYFPASDFTQATACTGGHSGDSSYQTLLDTHLNLSKGYSIAYYALDSLALLGDVSFPVPSAGARMCLSGQALDGGHQTLCMTSHYDNNIAEPGPYCIVALGQSYVSDGCYANSTAVTSAAPATVSSPATSRSHTSNQPSQTSASSNNIAGMRDCKPCGTNNCVFNNPVGLPSEVYTIIVGVPVENCDPQSNTSISTAIGGEVSITETWSETDTLGVHLGVDVQAQFGWSKSNSITYSQTITIEVPPGQVGALVANVLYNRTNGEMKIGSGQLFPLISNQPYHVNSYSQLISSCGSQIPANVQNELNCTSNASESLKGHNSLIVSVFPLMAAALIAL